MTEEIKIINKPNALERLKESFQSGESKLKDDEFLKDGLPYCKSCKTKRFFVSEDNDFAIRGMCKCQEEAAKQREEAERKRRFIENFNNRKTLSLIGERYKNIRFKDAIITENNKAAYEKLTNYAAKAKEVLENNIGIYIYGDNSSGKTFLTACLCNELVWKGYHCVYTNLASILNEIRKSYDSSNMGECEILNKLRGYDFAFIDDFGKEFLGREFNVASSKWAEEKLFEILNARYNAEKPTIFSSNYSISQLASILNLDKAIIERINEMSTRVIKLEGDDFRKDVREKKSEFAKELGI